MCHIILSSVGRLVLSYFCTLSQYFGKKCIEYKMCLLIFSKTFVWNISHFKKNWVRYDTRVGTLTPEGIPSENSKAWTGPLYSNSHINNRFYVPQKSVLTAPTQGTAWTHHTFTKPPPVPIPVRSFPKAILASLIADDNLQPYTQYIYF